MKHIVPYFLLISLIGTSCSTVKNVFDKKTAHEKYAKKLDKKDLDETPEGREWIADAKRVLSDAQTINLPYRQKGYFQSD